jgi:hypothetical protein
MRSPIGRSHIIVNRRRARRSAIALRRVAAWSVLALMLSTTFARAVIANDLADDFVLVRNTRNTTASVSRGDVKDLSVGKRKTWGSGAVVQLVLPPAGTPALGWFASAVVGVPEDALMNKIRQEVFKGELRKPLTAASDKDTLSAVAADPGTLGIVHAASAKSLPGAVAVLSIR